MTLPWDNNSWDEAQIAVRARRNAAAFMAGESRPETPLALRVAAERALLLQTLVIRGERTEEGVLIEAVTIPWLDIVALLAKDPKVAFEIPPEKWEEIIAGAYHRAQWDEVTLTPRSGDRGRDVIAVKKGVGAVRVIDQVKAFKPPHLVGYNDVRALMGVIDADSASKGFLTTTTDFAPKLRTDPLIKKYMPGRLQLINGEILLDRLKRLGSSPPEKA
jgi:restriction system protein